MRRRILGLLGVLICSASLFTSLTAAFAQGSPIGGQNPNFSGTSRLHFPGGTTLQRPLSPVAGDFRWNSTLGRFEGYDGAWKDVPIVGSGGASSGWVLTWTGSGFVLASPGSGSFAYLVQSFNSTPATGIIGINLVDASSTGIAMSIPIATGNTGATVVVKKTDATSNTVVITPAGGLIDGQSSATIFYGNQTFTIISDGTNWWII